MFEKLKSFFKKEKEVKKVESKKINVKTKVLRKERLDGLRKICHKKKSYKPLKKEIDVARKSLESKNKEEIDKILKFLKEWKSKQEFRREFPKDLLLGHMISANYVLVNRFGRDVFYRAND
jgi:histidyl-tRNA synthetase